MVPDITMGYCGKTRLDIFDYMYGFVKGEKECPSLMNLTIKLVLEL